LVLGQANLLLLWLLSLAVRGAARGTVPLGLAAALKMPAAALALPLALRANAGQLFVLGTAASRSCCDRADAALCARGIDTARLCRWRARWFRPRAAAARDAPLAPAALSKGHRTKSAEAHGAPQTARVPADPAGRGPLGNP
jgi:hypothetical protein